MLRNKVSIIGAGMSKFGMYSDKDVSSLCVEAFENACVENNLDTEKVRERTEALYISNFASNYFISQGHLAPIVARSLDLSSKPATTIEGACASGSLAIIQGVLAIASGMYDVVLVCGVEKMSGMSSSETTAGVALAAFPEERYVQYTFPQIFAKVATNYFNKYGSSYEDLVEIVIESHNKSVDNEKAQFNFAIRDKMNEKGLPIEMSEKDFLLSDVYNPIVASPLRRFDCAPVSDGAACVILANSEIARDFSENYLRVRGFGQGSGSETLLSDGNITSFSATRLAAKKAYEMSGVRPYEIDIAEVHDGFSIAGVLQMEDLGLAEFGDGIYKLVEKNGKLSVNMSGGLKCKGHPMGATGVAQVYDVCKRLLTNNCLLGLAQNFGGTGSTSAVIVLERVK